MPLYEYKCQRCGKTFEVLQKFADEPLKTHSECGGPVERLISAPAFHLKGTGWYATDYGKGNNGKPAKSEDSKSESRGEEKNDAKSESKAASTSSDSESKAGEARTESKPAASSETKPSPAA